MSRAATAEEKYAFCLGKLEEYLAGDNVLNAKVGKQIPLIINDEMKNLLLSRILKTKMPFLVKHLMDGLVTNVASEQCSEVEEKMKKAPTPTVRLEFAHLKVPEKGWSHGDSEDPCFSTWQLFFAKYQAYITQGMANNGNLKDSVKNNLPIDIAYSFYEEKMLRFMVLEPYPEIQEGCTIWVK